MNLSPDMLYWLVILIPSALFILIFGFGIIFGVVRGFRKSVILGIQAIVAFAIVLTLFLIFIFTDPDGKRIVSLVNTFMGEGGLQNKLSSSFNVTIDASKTSLKDILSELLPRVIFKEDSKAAYREIVINNGAYIMTLVTFIIRFAYAFVSVILYLLLVLIFYIIYLIFYPERRHRRKIERKYESLDSDKPYKKRRLLGMLIGGLRGLISSTLILSFIGSILFMVLGTDGNKKYEKKEFTNEKFNDIYSYYNVAESYGSNGVYKVLGFVKNKDNIPYYLYLTRIFYSGSLVDESRGINDNNVWMVEEFGTYTRFINATKDLLLKYGFDEFDLVIDDSLSGVTNKEHVEALANVLKESEFQTEFDKLIDDFESKVYFHNFALSLIDSVANNIDVITENMKDEKDEMTKTLLSILFKKGYVCKEIGETEGKEYPYLVASDILTKQDAKNLVKALTPILISNVGTFMSEKVDTKAFLSILKQALPEFKRLSILSDPDRKDNVNGTFERVYLYADKVMADRLSNNTQNGSHARLLAEASKSSGVDWTSELSTLLDVGLNLIGIADNVIPENRGEDFDILSAILYMFNVSYAATDAENERLSSENLELFRKAKASMSGSKLVALALTTSYLQDLLANSLQKIAPDLYIPSDLQYNEKTVDGKVIHGEIYNLFDALEYALKDKSAVDKIKNLMLDSEKLSNKDLLNTIGKLSEQDQDSNSVLGKLLESVYLRSIVSSTLVELNNKGTFGEIELYFPDSVFEEDNNGNVVKLIEKEELDILIDNLSDLTSSLIDYLDEESESYNDITVFINSESIMSILDSVIIEGTVSNVLKDKLGSIDTFVIPDDLAETEGWLSTSEKDGEVKVLIRSVKESHFDIKAILNASDDEMTDLVIDELNGLSQKEFETLLTSRIVYYTASNVIKSVNVSGFKIVIPQTAKEVTTDKYKGETFVAIKKNEISGLVKEAKHFVTQKSTADLLKTIISEKDELLGNNIFLASLASYVANNEDLNKVLIVPNDLKALASDEAVENITQESVWKTELSNVFDAINELVDLDDPDLKFDETLADSFKEQIKDFNGDSKKTKDETTKLSKLDVVYDSVIMQGTLTKNLDDAFESQVSTEALTAAKDYATGHTTADYLFIKKVEFKALIDTINILDIDLSGTVDVDGIIDQIFGLNGKVEATDTETKLDKIFKSIILRDLFTAQLDDAFTDLVDEDVRESTDVKETVSDVKVYLKAEVKSLIDILNEFNVTDLANFDSNTIKSDVPNLNKASTVDASVTKLHLMYNSYLVKSILADQLDNAFNTTLVNASARDSAKVKDFGVANKTYKETEVSGLIDVLNMFELTDLDSFDSSYLTGQVLTLNDKISTTSTKTKLDVLYSAYIVRYILNKQLDDSLSDTVRDGILEQEVLKEDLDTNPYYVQEQVSALIDALTSLGLTDINNVSGLDFSETIKTLDINTVYSSIIVADVLYQKLSETLNNNDFVVDHVYAKTTEWQDVEIGLFFYLEGELEMIQEFMEESNVSDISNLSVSQIVLTEESISFIMNSYILKATISKNIIENENVIVPVKSYWENEELLAFGDLQDLLNALAAMGSGSLNGFNASTLSLSEATAHLDDITSSYILRANITKNVKNGSDPIYVSDEVDLEDKPLYAVMDKVLEVNEYGEVKNDTASITILTKAEIINLINAIEILTYGTTDDTFNASVSFTTLLGITTEKQDTILKSNVMRFIVSDVILEAEIDLLLSKKVKYNNVRTNFDQMKVKVDDTSVDKFTYYFNEKDTTSYKYAFADKVIFDVYTLQGADDQKHAILTASDVMAFIFFAKQVTNGTYVYGTDFTIV